MVLFAWHLFRDRLPTKDNLYRRNVLAADAQICAGECGLSKTTSHLFLHCNFFGLVWNHILWWLGVVAVLPNEAAAHFYQFSFLGGAAKSRESILQVT